MVVAPIVVTFGNTPNLSVQELSALLSHLPASGRPLVLNHYQQQLQLPIPAQEVLMDRSGGIVKIAETVATTGFDSLSAVILNHLLQQSANTYFSLSSFSLSRADLQRLAATVKKTAPKPTANHYRILRSPQESAGIVSKYLEYQVIAVQEGFLVAFTTKVQDIKHWSIKDYSRPVADPKSGMLPPKVARMMINLALPQKLNPHTSLYDPFCGSGTLLVEALDLGLSAVGSDISKSAVANAQANCIWFANHFNPAGDYQVFLQDATQLKHLKLRTDAVVFEGLLGPVVPKPEKVPDIIKGLTKMYKGVFKQLPRLLNPGKLVVAALPEIVAGDHVKKLDDLVDWCEKNGYTLKAEPVSYGRNQAVVRRKIYQFRVN